MFYKFLRFRKIFSAVSTVSCTMSLLVASSSHSAAQEQGGSVGQDMGGVSGSSSPGFAGEADVEGPYLSRVKNSAKKGLNSVQHMQDLIGLGMHYNRAGRYADASRTLKQALKIHDIALKPTPPSARRPERVIERDHGNGTVSAEVVSVPMPYEETLQDLLPQLISAELEANELTVAETHIKRLIALKGTNPVADKLSLMSAYSSYSQLMRKLHRPKDAEMYQRKADEINSSFKPL